MQSTLETSKKQPGDLCEYCKAVAYHELPQENEPGLAHQPNLPALKTSAATCALCDLLLRGAYMIRKRIKKDKGRCVVFRTEDGLQYQTDFGFIMPKSGIKVAVPDADDSRQILEDFEDDFVSDETIKPWLYGNWWKRSRRLGKDGWQDAGDDDLQLIGIGIRLGAGPDIRQGEGNDGKTVKLRGTAVRLRTLADGPAAEYIPGRLVAGGVHFQPALEWIRNRMNSCEKDHRCCKSTTSLPTRVLNVGDGADLRTIRLEASGDRFGEYAALSHCWGSDRPAVTTTANLTERERHISLEELPKTFQESVWLTRQLGLKYLWIDSLCIVQDDKADWQGEAPRMSSVYGNASITFAASHSTGCHTGLFPPDIYSRKYRIQTPEKRAMGFTTVEDNIPFLGEDGCVLGTGSLFAWNTEYEYKGQKSDIFLTSEWMPASERGHEFVYQIEELGSPVDPLKSYPEHLSTRAWTLQERILPNRMLHFSADRMYWECRGEFVSEDGSQFQPQTHDIDRTLYGQSLDYSECGLDWSQKYMSSVESYPASTTIRSGRRLSGWLQHVEDFCSRQITFENDRLPALAGLAKRIQDSSDDMYLAGLWRNFMVEDLCWKTTPFLQKRDPGPGGFVNHFGPRLCHVTKAATYRAPSWSWASLNGHIEFLPLDFQHCFAKPLYTSLQPAIEGNFFGNMRSGWLKIEGPLLPIRLANPDTKVDRKLPLAFGTLCAMPTLSGLSLGEVYFDLESTNGEDEYLYTRDANQTSLSSEEALERIEEGRYYPYCGLFLDPSHCLVLRPVSSDISFRMYSPGAPSEGFEELVPTFERVGVGNFLRTERQVKATTNKDPGTRAVGDSYVFTKGFKYGPIDETYRRIAVIIV